MLQHQWHINKAPAAERYDVINRDRHIGKSRNRSEARDASKRVIYTLYYLMINSISLALLSDDMI
jgi:hypothetical protein